MNIKEALAAEHSRKQCDQIVKYISNNKERFAGLMNLFFDGEYRITQRAAWPMSYCVKNYPDLIRPYLNRLINNLYEKGLHDAVIRNTLRLLQDIEIPKKYHGKLMDTCFGYVQSNLIAPAIKAFSLAILQNLSNQYPDIIPELKLIIRERWEHETPAFRSRAKNFLDPK
jgi:hypothetical protein